MFWFLVPRLCLLPHHSSCFFLSVWMAAARGRQHLEEIRLQISVSWKTTLRNVPTAPLGSAPNKPFEKANQESSEQCYVTREAQ